MIVFPRREGRAPRFGCVVLGLSLTLGALVVEPSAAMAQGAADKATAEALFNAAVTLMKDGNAKDACPKLAESQRLDPAIGTHYKLADCLEQTGELTRAWVMFLDVAAEAKALQQEDRADFARKRAESLQAKLPRVTIDVPPEVAAIPGLQVSRDGVVVPSAQWGVPLPIDLGFHTVTASAPGRNNWGTKVEIVELGKTISVKLVPLEVLTLNPVAPATPAPAPQPAPFAPARDAPEETQPSSTLRTVGWVTAGVGLVGLGVGSVIGGLAIAKNGDSADGCDDQDRCTSDAATLRTDSIALADISTITFIAGGAVLAGGLALVLFAPSEDPMQTGQGKAALVARVGGVSFEGTW